MPFTNEQKNSLKAIWTKYKDGKTLWNSEDLNTFRNALQNNEAEMAKFLPGLTKNKEYFRLATTADPKDFSHLTDSNKGWLGYYSSISYYNRQAEIDANNLAPLATSENVLDPLLRRGVELAGHSKDLTADQRRNAKNANEAMTQKLLQDTLSNPANSLSIDQRNNAIKTNVFLAKNLLMAHLGGFYLADDKGRENFRVNENSIANTIAHGGRIMFIWGKKAPGESNGPTMDEAIFGSTEKRVGYRRAAGTHSLKFTPQKSGLDLIKEQGGVTHASFSGNRGVDLAVGGIGTRHPSGETIQNDGRNGHAFTHLEESTTEHNGVLLFGLEGSAPLKRDMVGHLHNPIPTFSPSKFSGMIGTKEGLSGAKRGGRQVDLTMYKEKDLKEMLEHFGAYYEFLQRSATIALEDGEAKKKLDDLNKLLSGKQMSVDKLKEIVGSVAEHYKKVTQTDLQMPDFMESLTNRDVLAEHHFSQLEGRFAEKVDEKEKPLDFDVQKLAGQRLRNPVFKMDPRFEKTTLEKCAHFEDWIDVSQRKIWGSGSPEFRKMHDAVKEFQTALKNGKDARVLSHLAKNLNERATAYIQLKNKPNLPAKTVERVAIATDIKDFSAVWVQKLNTRDAVAQQLVNKNLDAPAKFQTARANMNKGNTSLAQKMTDLQAIRDYSIDILKNQRHHRDATVAAATKTLVAAHLGFIMLKKSKTLPSILNGTSTAEIMKTMSEAYKQVHGKTPLTPEQALAAIDSSNTRELTAAATQVQKWWREQSDMVGFPFMQNPNLKAQPNNLQPHNAQPKNDQPQGPNLGGMKL